MRILALWMVIDTKKRRWQLQTREVVGMEQQIYVKTMTRIEFVQWACRRRRKRNGRSEENGLRRWRRQNQNRSRWPHTTDLPSTHLVVYLDS